MSLHYFGKSKEGVSKWGGGWSGIPTWFMVLFYTLNMVLGIAGLWVLAKGAGRGVPSFTRVLLLGEAALFYGIAKWAVAFNNRLQPLKSLEQIGCELKLSLSEISSLAAEQGVKPRIILNDVARYHPDDLSAAKVLLRASHKPIVVDNLLIPLCDNTLQDTSSLLRSTEKVR